MMYKGALIVALVGVLSACGHTPEERAASGLLIGGAIGAVVGLASDGDYQDHDRSRRHYHRDRHHRKRGWRRHDDWDDYSEYDDYDDYGCRYRC